MKYLFFDIECANCFDGKGKICEFGYIQTDDNFNVLEEDSIKINPCAPFDKKGFAIRGIRFEKPYEYYRTQPKFSDMYNRIKNLLQQPQQVVVGHGTSNDARYLLDDCKRYGLKPIDFEYCDTCQLAKLIYHREKNLKLKELYADLCAIDNVEQNHRGLEDAYMTMAIAKHYVQDLKMPLHNITTYYSQAMGESFAGRIIQAGIPDLAYDYIDKTNKKNMELIQNYMLNEMAYNAEKTYVLFLDYVKHHFKETIIIINRLKQLKRRFSFYLSNNAVCVLNNEDDRTLEKEMRHIDTSKYKENVQNIDFEEFLAEIGLTEQDLKPTQQDLDEIIGNMQCNKGWYHYYKKTHSIFYKINDTLKDEQFECSVDFPVIQYVANIVVEVNGQEKTFKSFVFYDYVMDSFFNLHPYRVNRGANSYLDKNFYQKAKKRSIDRAPLELARQFKVPLGGKIKNITIEHEYPYITSYKFRGNFVDDTLQFEFPSQILADDDFKGSAKVDLSAQQIDLENRIKELYDNKSFSLALCNMSKFRFRYKDKTFCEPKIINKTYRNGDEMLLPKQYYLLSVENNLDETYLPSLINVQTDLFKHKLQLPILIRRK